MRIKVDSKRFAEEFAKCKAVLERFSRRTKLRKEAEQRALVSAASLSTVAADIVSRESTSQGKRKRGKRNPYSRRQYR